MEILDALSAKRDFTETEAAIADHILEHADDVLELTIGDLARLVHCSNSAVVRFCQKLGLEGYRDLRVELAKALERKRLVNFEVNPDRPFIEDNTTAEIASAIASLTRQAVSATAGSLKIVDIRRAARLLLGARRVVYYAAGDSLVSAEMFATLMMKIGIVCIDGFYKADFGSVGQLLDARDVVLIITHSGQMLETYERPLATIRAKGCKTIVITADPTLGERLLGTNCLITLPQGESRAQRLATFYSQECIRYVLNCIYAEAFSVNYTDNVRRMDAIEHQLSGE